MEDRLKEEVPIIGGNKLISDDQLYPSLYKSLSWLVKIKKEISVDFLKARTAHKELTFHPLWLAKMLVMADRKPFPPKKIPMMCFVDAVSGYRGLMSSIPETTTRSVEPSTMIIPRIEHSDDVKRYIKDVQKTQVNRSYILKKPKHKIVDFFLVYLPLWKIEVDSDLFPEPFVINANTGESEDYMRDQWHSEKWLEIKK